MSTPNADSVVTSRNGLVRINGTLVGHVERKIVGSRIEWEACDVAGRYLTTQGSRALAVSAVTTEANRQARQIDSSGEDR